MNDQMNLDTIATVSRTKSYNYTLTLQEFNGECRIIYSTNSPLLCNGTINLVTTDGPSIVAYTNANPTGGHFDTGKPWGSGWYAQWNGIDAYNKPVILVTTPITTN